MASQAGGRGSMGTSLSISCNNRSRLKMYQGLLLNSSKMALRGEIIMSLGTKWNRLPVQIHSEINIVHSWSLWFLLTSSLVCHFPPSPPPCHISWECQMQVELNFPFILCFYLETEWGTLYLHRCAFSSAYVGSHQESHFKTSSSCWIPFFWSVLLYSSDGM